MIVVSHHFFQTFQLTVVFPWVYCSFLVTKPKLNFYIWSFSFLIGGPDSEKCLKSSKRLEKFSINIWVLVLSLPSAWSEIRVGESVGIIAFHLQSFCAFCTQITVTCLLSPGFSVLFLPSDGNLWKILCTVVGQDALLLQESLHFLWKKREPESLA